MREMMGESADMAGGDLDFEHVAKGLFDEDDSLAVVRPVGAFAEPCQPARVGG